MFYVKLTMSSHVDILDSSLYRIDLALLFAVVMHVGCMDE